MNQELYRETIELVSSQLAEKVLSTETGLSQRLLQLDAELRPVVQAIGLLATQKVMNTCAKSEVEVLRAQGMTIDQHHSVPIMTVFGQATVASPRLRARRGYRGVCRPVHEVLGLRGKMRSQAVERALCDFGAEESFEQAARRFAEHYGFEVGRTTILRIVHEHAAQGQAFVDRRLQVAEKAYDMPIRKRPGVDEMLLGLDGCQIRTGVLVRAEGEQRTAVRNLPKRQRQTAWRDVRLALCRPLTEVDPTYVGAMDGYDKLVSMLFKAAVSRGLSSRTQPIAVADGGFGLAEELAAQFPKLAFILDKYHLVEHLADTAEQLGLQDEAKRGWIAHRLQALSRGEVDKVIAELEAHVGQGDIRTAQLAKHLRRFRKSVEYDTYRALGWPVGSGETESAHRTIPQKRMKLPGAWWRPEHINPMMALRILRQNGWWKEYWQCHSQALAA